MSAYFRIAEILVSLVLILAVLLQTKGSSFNGTFSSDSSVFRTRRGVEKTLFEVTVGICILFVVISILSVVVKP